MTITAVERRRRALWSAAERSDAAAGASAVEPASAWRPAPLLVATEPLRRLAADTGDRRDPLGGAPIPDHVLAELSRGRGRGGALPSGIRGAAQQLFGADLSAVRLHTDERADALARSVQSVAFSHGADVYFSSGSFEPRSDAGSRLLAHELAHVAEGSAGGHGPGGIVGRADDAAEERADRAAQRIAPALRRSVGGTVSARPADRASGDATSSPVAGPPIDRAPLTRQPLRRKITATSADIAATRREKSGMKKLTGAKDGLDKLGKLLDIHRTKTDQQEQIGTLTAITGLARAWLAKHTDPKEAATRALLEDVLAEASRDLGQARAQQRYVNDMRAGYLVPENRVRLAHDSTATPFTQHLNVDVPVKASAASASAAPDKTYLPNHPARAGAELIREAGLTEAEITAIKMYTGSAYLFMNPATAGDSEWLAQQVPAMQHVLDSQARTVGQRTVDTGKMREEGVVHSGVAMQGLAKMEVKKGTSYRGARMTPEKFDEAYGKRSHVVYKGFTSTGLEESTADLYARGGGERKPDPDQTVSVKCFFEVNDARDIKAISETPRENEWLLLPGASFEITKIVDAKQGDPGAPGVTPATAWKEVYLTQVSPKDVPPEKPAVPAAPAVPASMQKLASGDFSVPPRPAVPRPTLGPLLAMQNLARGKFQR